MFSTIFYGVVAAACILIGIYCAYLYCKRRARQDLVYDNSGFFLMLVSGVFLGVLVLYLLIVGEGEIALAPALVALICLLGLLSWHNEMITFDETGFTRRDFLMRTQRYSYRDITDCSERVLRQTRKRQEVQTLFYLDKKRFSLSRKCANYGEFARRVRKYGADGLDP